VLRRSWRPLLGAAACIAFVLYAASQRDALAGVWQHLQPRYFLLLCGVAALFLWTQGKIFQQACRAFGLLLGEREAFALAILTTAGNYSGALRLGAVAKAVYLKRARGLALTDTAVILAGISVVGLLTAVACALPLWFHLRAWRTAEGTATGIALVALGVLLVVTLVVPVARMAGALERVLPRFARQHVTRLLHAWNIIGRPRAVLRLVLWHLLGYAIATIGIYAAFALLLDRPIGLAGALALTVLTSLAGVVALTPGNIGVQEFLIVASAHAFQVGQEAGIAVAAALRLVQIAVLVALLPLAWRLTRAQPRGREVPVGSS
jgi:uncharacterized membrane protein YbhN (UPF0104 family)